MTEISQSHGTLNSTTEESSTPSNNSEYFSVTSSLDIINFNDEVYYSMDEESEETNVKECNFNQYRKYRCQEFKNQIQKNFAELTLCDGNEGIPEIFINESIVNSEDWDTVCDNLNSVISQEYISTDEEDDHINDSVFTESVLNNPSIERHDSDNEENTSVSINNITQMTSSVIEGELSEMNDIVYESSLSQDPCVIEEDSVSLKADEKTEDIPELEMSILEMVRKIEFSELEVQGPSELSVTVNEVEVKEEQQEEESIITLENIIPTEYTPEENQIFEADILNIIIKEELCKKVEDKKSIKSSKSKTSEGTPKSKQIDIVDDSPIKTFALCCSIKRKRVKGNQPKLKPSKSKSLFSFLRFYKKDKIEQKSPKSLPQLNVDKENQDLYVIVVERDEYQCIPFIDADIGVYSDSYIPLAKQEVYCE